MSELVRDWRDDMIDMMRNGHRNLCEQIASLQSENAELKKDNEKLSDEVVRLAHTLAEARSAI